MTKPTYDLEPRFTWNPGTAVPIPFGEGNCIEGRGWELEELEGTFEFTAEEETVSEMLFSLKKWPFVAVADDGAEIEVTITDFVVCSVSSVNVPPTDQHALRWICTPVDWEIK